MYSNANGLGVPKSPRREMESNRFAGLRLEDLQGDMHALCKDQFGCRYLQKKLEEKNPEYRDMIFNEIFPHFGELMTDGCECLNCSEFVHTSHCPLHHSWELPISETFRIRYGRTEGCFIRFDPRRVGIDRSQHAWNSSGSKDHRSPLNSETSSEFDRSSQFERRHSDQRSQWESRHSEMFKSFTSRR
jgi:hypothetical protein